jgi:iron-sulfur cluster assembly accessory protein
MSVPGLSLWLSVGHTEGKKLHVPSRRNHTPRRELEHMSVQQETTQQGVILTEGAAAKVSSLLAGEGRDDLKLRIAVQPGGCSGLRYQLYFDDRAIDGDIVADFGGVEVVTDKMSAPYLMGATVDFVDTIEKQGFTIDNPNASGSCACGDSFH